MSRICFVCLGNICRSPTAEGVMRHMLQQAGKKNAITIDSAGTSAHHVGEPPDRRAVAAAARRGVDVSGTARQFNAEDFQRFDYILAMDRRNLEALHQLAETEADHARIRLFRDFDADGAPGQEVPDPYYGGPNGFEEVLDICQAACNGLLDHLQQRAG